MNREQKCLETTDDAVLGGRLQLRQLRRGHRVGHDAILLAAATGACSGEQAVDLGAGVGAAGLALAARVPGLTVTLIEIDESLCALAAENAARNGMAGRVRTIASDAENKDALVASGLVAGSMDHVLMNPPFNDLLRHNVSPDPRRRLAHVATSGLFARWVATAAWLLKPRGVLTLIWRADALAAIIAGLTPGFGAIAILPIYPRVNTAAIRVIVGAIKGAQGGQSNLPGLVLNDEHGRPTQPAEAILRSGAPLSFAGQPWPIA
jgi:tRNA1(Val) A37 N6-methylase TrmN6